MTLFRGVLRAQYFGTKLCNPDSYPQVGSQGDRQLCRANHCLG
jgi:hypothetical protein